MTNSGAYYVNKAILIGDYVVQLYIFDLHIFKWLDYKFEYFIWIIELYNYSVLQGMTIKFSQSDKKIFTKWQKIFTKWQKNFHKVTKKFS